MMRINKLPFKFTGLLAGVFLLIFAASCSTDDDDNGDKLPESILVAKADLNFIDEEEAWQLSCYRQDSYGELAIYGDTLFSLRLSDTDLYGSAKLTASILISLTSVTGFEAGKTYQFSEIQSDDQSGIFVAKHRENGSDMYAISSGTDADGDYADTGSLTITSLSSNRVEGIFSFTAHSLAESPKKLKVTNGSFHGDLYRIQ